MTTSLRQILASWVYAHVSNCLDNDADIEQNRVDLAVPPPGGEMHKFYTFLLKIEDILRDKSFGGRYDQWISDDLHFIVPPEDLDKPITWKYLKRLCRLLHFFNNMKNEPPLLSVLAKHVPGVVKNLDTLEKSEPTFASLLFVVQMKGKLRDTASVSNALDQLMHRILGTDDDRVNGIFDLTKKQSYVFVNGVLDLARQLFEPILQYLPAEDKESLTILDLVKERLPESLLQQTLWKNLETSAVNEVGSSDVRRLRSSKQEQGPLCWEFISALLSEKYCDDVLHDEVFEKNDLRGFHRFLDGASAHENETLQGQESAVEKKHIFKLSMYSISALLLLSSKTLVHCQCATKTVQFVSLIFATFDEAKLKMQSLANCKVLVFASHEVSKFPMALPSDRFNFRNMFITYRQADIFERPPGTIFKYEYLNELNFIRMLEIAGLQPTQETLIHLLLELKNDPTVVLSDFLYLQLLHTITYSFGSPPFTSDLDNSEIRERYRSLSSTNALLRLYGAGVYNATTIFCLSFVQKMAYFSHRAVLRAINLIPIIQFIDFNTRNNLYPITSAMLQMYLRHLPGRHNNSTALTSASVDSQHMATITMFKYLSLVVNVMILEHTKGKYTMVDFIEQSGQITLY
uniref:Uncharacterized protein IVSP3-1 n=1 Tax=Hyposoter didymator TaxID=260305 RepID=D7P5N1_HYPDD|nr:unknown [Hyposoter didymator]